MIDSYLKKVVLIFVIFLVFFGCGDESALTKTSKVSVAISGKSVDGYLEDAVICLDDNQNNRCDTGEVSTVSTSGGNFQLQGQSTLGYRQLITIGGKDSATGAAFSGLLKELIAVTQEMEFNLTNITPLTTLSTDHFYHARESNASYTPEQAKKTIAEHLGMSVEDLVDDPMRNTVAFKKSQQLIQTTFLIQASLADDNQSMFSHIMGVFAQSIADDNLSNDFNVSNALAALQNVPYRSTSLELSDDVEKLIEAYSTEIGKYIVSATEQNEKIQQQLYVYATDARDRIINNDIAAFDDVIQSINAEPEVKPTLNEISISSPSAYSINENNASTIFNIVATDTDAMALTYTLTGSDADAFVLDEAKAEYIFKDAPDYETKKTYSITLSVSDGEITSTQDIVISIVDIVEEPIIEGFSVAINENLPAGTEVGTLTLLSRGDTNISSFYLSDTYNFDINITGKITTKRAFDYEQKASYLISTYATNSSGNSNIVMVEVAINDIVEKPTLSAVTYWINENLPIGSVVGNISILSDGGADISGFSLSNTETFSISNQGVITTKKILDYEDTFRYELNASATNSIGQSDSIAFNIYVNNMIDVAAVLEDTEVAILENASPGDVAGTIRIITTGDSPITAFALGGVGSENFDLSNAGVISLKSGASLNYNADKDYFLTAVATNSLGDSNTVDIKISVIEYFTPFQIAKLRSQNSSNFPRFGSAVSMSGDYIVVGAYGDDTNENHIGKVHLFKRQLDDTLIELNFPDIHDSIASDNFGWSLSIDGDYIVVGAKNKDTAETGSAYVYRRFSDNNIALIKKIQHSDSKANDNFGYAVSISGDYISIGAINDDTNATNAGSVYLYKKDSNDTITQLSKLYASDAQAQDLFGYSLSMDQGYLVVGALHEDSRGNNAGSAYLYKIQSDTNITQIAKIQPSDIEADDYFANAVSMDGDFIVVGAIGEDTTASHAGSVYLFKRNSDTSVTQIAKIQAKDPTTDNAFGSSVSIKGVFIAVGAIGDDSIASGAGSAYLFKIKPDETLVQIADKLTAHDAEANDNFGNAIAIDGDYVVVGAYREDTGSQSAGSAYVFNVEPEDKIYIYAEPADQININESFRNSSFILDAASPSGAVSYTLSGIDEGEMVLNVNESIVPHNAILSFLNVSDYELPSDIGVDNSYEVDILLSDQNDVTNDRVMHKKLTVFDRYFFDIQRIEANDPDINDYFGSGVSMSGDMIAISAPSEDTQGFGAGSVYIYKKNSNHSVTLVQKLQANDIEQGDAFGSSVDMDSEYLVIGAKYEDETAVSAGAVYLYKKVSTGKFEQFDKLMGKSAYEYFGASVAIHDDNVIIGAPGKDDTRGVAYHYNITDQNLTSYFHKSREVGDSFGYSVGISGDYFTVGAIHEDSNGSNAGSAYLFKRGNTTQIKHLNATDAEAEDLFGYSVGMNGNYILIGAKDEDSNGANAGSAYLFKRENDSNITQIAKIQSDDIQANDNFGSSVSINSDYIVVGAMGEDSTALDSGSVYIFKRNSDHDNDVTQMAKIQALHYGISDSDNSDSFGVSVDIDNDNIIVGAHGRDTTSIKNSGAAYLYKKDPNQP